MAQTHHMVQYNARYNTSPTLRLITWLVQTLITWLTTLISNQHMAHSDTQYSTQHNTRRMAQYNIPEQKQSHSAPYVVLLAVRSNCLSRIAAECATVQAAALSVQGVSRRDTSACHWSAVFGAQTIQPPCVSHCASRYIALFPVYIALVTCCSCRDPFILP